MIIPYIITPDGKGVCYWAVERAVALPRLKDGGIAKLGNTCSDFEEEDEQLTEYLAEWNAVPSSASLEGSEC
jgi:hypothetical protein